MTKPTDFQLHARSLVFKTQVGGAVAGAIQFAEPSQVEMRRAISSAYHALFHCLTTAGAQQFSNGGIGLCNQAARAVSHSGIRKVCDGYVRSPGQTLPPYLAQVVSTPADTSFLSVANAFARLQEGREIADYDLAALIDFQSAAQLVTLAGDTLSAFDSVRGRPETAVFLTALLPADRWSRRG